MNKKAKSGVAIFIIILLILLGIGAYIIIQSGALEKATDPCKKQFEECNYQCGEGFLNSICKSGCTEIYQECKNG